MQWIAPSEKDIVTNALENRNYLWIQLFDYSLANPSTGSGRGGRAGFVMANSASDARSSEQEIRQQLIGVRAVNVMINRRPQDKSSLGALRRSLTNQK